MGLVFYERSLEMTRIIKINKNISTKVEITTHHGECGNITGAEVEIKRAWKKVLWEILS